MKKKTRQIGIFIAISATITGCLTKSLWSLPLPTSGDVLDSRTLFVDDAGNSFVLDTAKLSANSNTIERVRLVDSGGKLQWDTLFPITPFEGAAGAKKEEEGVIYTDFASTQGLNFVQSVARCEYTYSGSLFPNRICDKHRTDIYQITKDNQVSKKTIPVIGYYAKANNGNHVVIVDDVPGTDSEGQPAGVWGYDADAHLIWKYTYESDTASLIPINKIVALPNSIIAARGTDTNTPSYKLLALNPENGNQNWMIEVPTSRIGALLKDTSGRLIVSDSVYHADTNHYEYRVKSYAENGTVRWAHSTFEAGYSSIAPELVATGNYVCYSYSESPAILPKLACLNANTGAVSININAPYPAQSSAGTNPAPFTNFDHTTLKASANGGVFMYSRGATNNSDEYILVRINPANGQPTSKAITSSAIYDAADGGGTQIRELLRNSNQLLLNNYQAN